METISFGLGILPILFFPEMSGEIDHWFPLPKK